MIQILLYYLGFANLHHLSSKLQYILRLVFLMLSILVFINCFSIALVGILFVHDSYVYKLIQ